MRSFGLLVVAVLAVLLAASVFLPVAAQNGVGEIIVRKIRTNNGVTTPFRLTLNSLRSLTSLRLRILKESLGQTRPSGRGRPKEPEFTPEATNG